MKKYFLSIFSLLLLLSVSGLAQNKEMTKEEWEAEMSRLRQQKETLTQQVNTAQTDVNNMKNQPLPSVDDCMNSLYQMVGASKSDIDNFRRAVAELDGRIKRKEGPKDDRQKDLNVLKMNKISALPEFFNKVHNDMQRSLDSWVASGEQEEVKSYTVVKGDCLWRIAKKPEHYGNGFAWPVIYKANRDQIKNPDLIYPKQVFKIPSLTEEEKAKYEKLKKNYKPAPVQ